MVRVEDATAARLAYFSLRALTPMKPRLSFRLCLAIGVLPVTILSQKVEIQGDHDADFLAVPFIIREGFLKHRNPALNTDVVRVRAIYYCSLVARLHLHLQLSRARFVVGSGSGACSSTTTATPHEYFGSSEKIVGGLGLGELTK